MDSRLSVPNPVSGDTQFGYVSFVRFGVPRVLTPESRMVPAWSAIPMPVPAPADPTLTLDTPPTSSLETAIAASPRGTATALPTKFGDQTLVPRPTSSSDSLKSSFDAGQWPPTSALTVSTTKM